MSRSADPYADFLDAIARLAATSKDGEFWFTPEVLQDCLDNQVAVDIVVPPEIIKLRVALERIARKKVDSGFQIHSQWMQDVALEALSIEPPGSHTIRLCCKIK